MNIAYVQAKTHVSHVRSGMLFDASELGYKSLCRRKNEIILCLVQTARSINKNNYEDRETASQTALIK